MKVKFTVLALLFTLSNYANSQQLMTENFDYTSGTPLTANGWSIIAPISTVLPISITNTGLSFTGYTLSGIGNATRVDSTGQDIYRDLYSNTATASIYTSFMLNVTKATTAGDYFFAYLPQNSTNGFVGRLYLKSAGIGFYRLGVTKGATTNETVVYSADSFAVNNTSLVVIKYQFIAGITNDSISVYHFTTLLPSTEPTPTFLTTGGVSTDAVALGRLALRQGTAANSPRLIIDGIRTANTWAGLNAPTNTNQPAPFTITFTTTTFNSTKINWTKNGNYIDSTMTTLVFVKPLTQVNIGTPTLSASAYTANSNYTLGNSFYQNDVAAKCVMMSDSNTVTVTGLNQNTLYHVSILTVRNLDSAYAIATNGSISTLSTAPRAVTGLNVTAIGPTIATINWLRPIGYSTTSNSIVVYVKATSVIAAGTPNTSTNAIIADSSFIGLGSIFLLDSGARCVFKGDNTTISITGLNAATNYFIAAYAINDIDSNYSSVLSGTFRTNNPGPVNVKSASLVSFNATSCKISWIKDAGYDNDNFTTLVFLKQGAAITQGTPSFPTNTIIANDSFTLGSTYQNDSTAFCVYKGDSTFVIPINLNPATSYFALIYVISTVDSLYSNPTIASGITRSVPPNNVSAVTITGIGITAAKTSWTKPVGYNNTTFTTLVFIKAFTAISEGIPTRTVNFYNANASFSSNFSTRYQNDTASKCIYKGDTNFVNVTSINNYTNYHVLIYVVRDADSTYSTNGAFGTGTASPNPPPPINYTISQINAINKVTGVPDSLNLRVALRGVVYGSNQRTVGQGGLQFLLRDNTAGITITNNANTFGYTPKQGDSISVFGIVSSARGLLTLNNLDSLSVLGSGKTLANPKLITKLNETTENDLVRINTVKFLTKPVGNVFAANTLYQVVSSNNDTATIRIYGNSGLVGALFPTTTYFHVIGLGSQSSNNNAPFAFAGYQILPRFVADVIDFNPLNAFNFVKPNNNSTIKIEGDTAQKLNFIWTKSIHDSAILAPTYNILIDTLNGNFRNAIATYQSGNTGLDSNKALTYSQIRNLVVSLGTKTNQSIALKFKVLATSSIFTVSSDTIIVNFTLGYMVGVQNQSSNSLLVYPNPIADELTIQLPENRGKTAQIEIIDLTGKVIVNESVNIIGLTEIAIPCQALNKGMYLIRLSSNNLIFTKKMLKD
jgi:hypothetical protein